MTPNAAGTRIVFLHRWLDRQGDQVLKRSRLCTANPDGSGLRVLVAAREGYIHKTGLSHPKWFGDQQVMVWNSARSRTELYDEPTGRCTVVGAGRLTGNGHFSRCPVNPDWMISDAYPDGTHVVTRFDPEPDGVVIHVEVTGPDVGSVRAAGINPCCHSFRRSARVTLVLTILILEACWMEERAEHEDRT